jgi:hypothetical protein
MYDMYEGLQQAQCQGGGRPNLCSPAASAGVAAQPLIHAAYESAGVPWEVSLLLPSLIQSIAGVEPALQVLLLLHLACVIFRTLQIQEASKAGEETGQVLSEGRLGKLPS